MRLPSRLALLFSCLVLTAAASVACHGSSDDGSDVSTGRLTGTVKPGAEFVRCWSTNDGNADEFFRVYTISCHASSSGLGALTGSRIDVDSRVANGNVSSAILDGSMDKDVVVGRASKSDFPLSLDVYGQWSTDGFSVLSAYRTTLALAEAATTAAPLVVKMPFSTWPLRFLNRNSNVFVQAAAYTVDAAPFITSQDINDTGTTFQDSILYTGAGSSPVFSLDAPAPKLGSITLAVDSSAPKAQTQITGPGTYVIDSDGVHIASAAEEQEADNASSDAGVDAAPPTSAADSGAPPAVDSGAPAVPTTCGNSGQAPCNTSGVTSCNPGTRYDQLNDDCQVCGAANQVPCFSDPTNASGNPKCNNGTRYDQLNDACQVCGAANQVPCFTDPANASGNPKCNDGTRYDQLNNDCLVCGAAGQTYCDSDPTNASGNPKCNPGLTYSSFNGTCN